MARQININLFLKCIQWFQDEYTGLKKDAKASVFTIITNSYILTYF